MAERPTTTVDVSWQGGFKFVSRDARGMTLTVDVPKEDGDEPAGFMPGDMMLTSLVGCSGVDIVEILRKQRRLLADVGEAMAANARRPAASLATASIFQEFSAGIVSAAAPDLVVYDGELGDMPVLVVIPDESAAGIIEPLGMDESATARAINFFERTRVRYLEVSSNTRLIHTPPGTGHNYPYETPEFVVEVVRDLLAELGGEPGETTP